MNEIKKLLDELSAAKFYGSLELKLEAGRVVLIRKSETFKPTEPNYGNNRSESHDRTNNR